MSVSETATSSPAPSGNKGALLTVFLVVFVDLLGFGIVLPLLPRYTDQYIPADTPEVMKGVAIGLILSAFSAMQFIFAPIWGRLSDRIGRRPVLIIGLAGSVVFYGLFGIISDTLLDTGWLFISLILLTRIGAGIAGATISTAAAVIADSTTKEKRASGMALIGAAFGIGFTFGPLIAYLGVLFLKDYPGAPGYAASLLSAIALLVAWKKLPETRKEHTQSTHKGWLKIGSLIEVLKTPTVGLLVLIFFMATFGFAGFEATLSVVTQESFSLSTDQNYLVFAYVGFVLMFAQGFVYRKLVKKLDEIALMRIGLASMFLGLINLIGVTIVASEQPGENWIFSWFMVSLAISVFGFAFLNPSVNALISRRSDPNRQGEVLGVNQSFSALARILGPVIALTLFKLTKPQILPYLMSAGLLLCVLLLLPKIKRNESPA